MEVSMIDWNVLFDSLLQRSTQHPYELDVTDSTITITADPADAAVIKEKLEKSLNTTAAFHQSLPYQIEGAPDYSDASNDIIPLQAPGNTVASNVEQLTSLFGQQAIDDIAINFDALIVRVKS